MVSYIKGGLEDKGICKQNHIRVDLKEIGIHTWNWVNSSQDWNYWRFLVNASLNLIIKI
jgi:hypothetical protein